MLKKCQQLEDSLAAVVRRCITVAEADRIFEHISELGLEKTKYLGNLLVEMYGRVGRVEEAYQVFERIARPNVYSWNIMITAFSHNGEEQRAFVQFRRMQLQGMKADRVTWLVLLDACTSLASGSGIRLWIEETVERLNVPVRNAMLHMYGRFRCLEQAEDIFRNSPQKDVITWGSMLTAFVHSGKHKQALKLVESIDQDGTKLSYVTYISLLEACVGLKAYNKGVEIHERIKLSGIEYEVNLGNALLSMYERFGDVAAAEDLFEEMGEHGRNLVSWNAMLAAYAHNKQGLGALSLLRRMDFEGLKPSKVSFLSMLDACPTLSYAGFLHLRVAEAGYEQDLVMKNALINMHSRCGNLKRAREIFEAMQRRDVCSWSTLIDAYAQKGHQLQALDLFTCMLLEGFKPSDITLVSVLSACSHAGLVKRGWDCFILMFDDFGIEPAEEHVGCIVDLFGRLGWLDAANACASTSFRENPVAWIILLAACKTHGDVGLGKEAADLAMQLDPQTQTSYILLSNMYTVDQEDEKTNERSW